MVRMNKKDEKLLRKRVGRRRLLKLWFYRKLGRCKGCVNCEFGDIVYFCY